MDSNRITKTPTLNPRDKATYPQDKSKGEVSMVACGYEVLDRNDVRSRFNQDRKGLSDPVYPHSRIYED